jgi:hypothetical protein
MYRLSDEKKLNQFLNEINTSMNNFKVTRVNTNVYGSRVIEMVEPASNIRIRRTEYQEGSKDLEDGQYYYTYNLPGISLREFLRGQREGLVVEHISFAESMVEKLLRILIEAKLLTQVMIFHDEPRFDLTQESLREFIRDCWLIHGMATVRMHRTWQYIRPEALTERKWWYDLWGENKRNNMNFRDFRQKRLSLKKNKKKTMNVFKTKLRKR